MVAGTSMRWRRGVAAMLFAVGTCLTPAGLRASAVPAGEAEANPSVASAEAGAAPHAPAPSSASNTAGIENAPPPAVHGAATPSIPAATPSSAWTSERRYEVSWTSNPTPVPLLAFHEWTLTVRDAEGRPADGLVVEVRGGMPEHDHGLPSAPVVTPLGGGRYRIEGLRFHMPGAWVVLFTFSRDATRDTLRVELSL